MGVMIWHFAESRVAYSLVPCPPLPVRTADVKPLRPGTPAEVGIFGYVFLTWRLSVVVVRRRVTSTVKRVASVPIPLVK